MNQGKEDLFATELPTLQIDKRDKSRKYKKLGEGGEGVVYKYNDSLAFKTFENFLDKYKLLQKFQKIELLAKLHDESFCFPLGLVGYKDNKKEGYYTKLVNPNKKIKDFYQLRFLKDQNVLINYLVKTDEAMKRIHQKGVIIGDIRGDNIMIDQNDNPIFIDTDNYAYAGYGIDLADVRNKWLSMAFSRPFSPMDNDKYVFAMMAMQFLIKNTILENHQKEIYFKELIKSLDVEPEIKDGLREIFSDTDDKPYISPILQRIKPNKPLLSKSAAVKVNRL